MINITREIKKPEARHTPGFFVAVSDQLSALSRISSN
jgi:hypothetical protein